MIYWFTGQPGAGKTVLANKLMLARNTMEASVIVKMERIKEIGEKMFSILMGMI